VLLELQLLVPTLLEQQAFQLVLLQVLQLLVG
jgi:hypothetical protein